MRCSTLLMFPLVAVFVMFTTPAAAQLPDIGGAVDSAVEGVTGNDVGDAVRGTIDANVDAQSHVNQRYRQHNGYWWYRTNDNRWLYWRDGSWYYTDGNAYSRSHTGANLGADVHLGDGVRAGVGADTHHDSRYRRHNGHWWYHTDDGAWLYWRNGSWYNTDGHSRTHSRAQGDVQFDTDERSRGELDFGGEVRGLIDR